MEVTPPQGEGGAPDDERGEDAAPMLERHPSGAGGGPGGEEGSGAVPGGAVSAAKVLDDGGVEEDVVFLQVRRRSLVVAPCCGVLCVLFFAVGFYSRPSGVGVFSYTPHCNRLRDIHPPLSYCSCRCSPISRTNYLELELDKTGTCKGGHIKAQSVHRFRYIPPKFKPVLRFMALETETAGSSNWTLKSWSWRGC